MKVHCGNYDIVVEHQMINLVKMLKDDPLKIDIE